MLPTLSHIHAWDTEHLIEAAYYWTKVADQWEDVFKRCVTDPTSSRGKAQAVMAATANRR